MSKVAYFLTVSREGTNKMLQSLQAAGVPVLVFSAGLGDSVSAVLRYHNVLLSNVHIISNYLQFDGLQVNGFKGDIIHSFNKNEHAVEKSDYFQVSTADSLVHILGTFVCNFLYRVFCDVL
jgi:5'-nucleotidase